MERCGNYNAETYIEQKLLERCSINERKIKIYFGWQACKSEYVDRTSTIVYDFQHYSLHDHTHSASILESIEMLLSKERIDKLGIGDLWLILQVAYGHDIGMCICYDELKEIWAEKDFRNFLEYEMNNQDSNARDSVIYYKQIHNLICGQNQMNGIEDDYKRILEFEKEWPLHIKKDVNIIIGEYLRKNHAKRSEAYIEKYLKLISKGPEERLYRVVGQVSYAHSADFSYILKEIPFEVDAFGNEKMHPQFVAALLRIGDLLDMDNNRFNHSTLEHFGRLPQISHLHYGKHLAISHLRITEREIEAVAKTDKSEVAQLSRNWFTAIEEEMKNFTSNWNIIVPEKIGGCIFKKCDLEVFLNGSIYTEQDETHFNINKQKISELLMGDNIYKSKLDCFRELIQNAMDATKVRIWIDVENGEFDNELSLNGKERKGLLPFDLTKTYLDRFVLEIEYEVLKDEGMVSFTIKDRGIGIDKECVNAISTIGSGWRGRTHYRDYIATMPKWLMPTGGFGIGMQSVFMLTEEIEILTKSEYEDGMKIIMKSPRSGGEICCQKVAINNKGTSISFKIPIVTLYQTKEFENIFYVEAKRNASGAASIITTQIGGYFDYERIADVLFDGWFNWLGNMFPNSLVPIILKCKNNRKQKRVFSHIGENLVQSFEYDSEKKIWFHLENKTKKFILWDEVRQLYMELNRKEGRRDKNRDIYTENKFCFKNVLVKEAPQEIPGTECAYMFIDFMGYRAEDCLEVQRNSFRSSFDVSHYSLDLIHLYVHEITNRIMRDEYSKESMKKEPYSSDSLLIGIESFLIIDGISFGFNSDIFNMLTEKNMTPIYVKSRDTENNDGQNILENKTLDFKEVYELLSKKEKSIYFELKSDTEVRNKFSLKDYIHDNEDKNSSNLNAERSLCLNGLANGAPIFVYKELENLWKVELSVVISRMLRKYADDPQVVFKLDDEMVVSMWCNKNSSQIEHSSERIADIINEVMSRHELYIIASKAFDEDYSILYVDKLPFSSDDERRFCKEKNLIIVPFGTSIYAMLETKYGNGFSLEQFLGKVREQSNLKNCIEWVVRHSRSGCVHKKEEIEKAYISLCKKMYFCYKEKHEK